MLGLKRGLVHLTPHENDWLEIGQEICRRVETACRDLQIVVEHVGSTSVVGLHAKPILDIVLGLPARREIENVRRALVDDGFVYRGEGEGSNGFLFVLESEPEVRTVHLHAVLRDSNDWKDYVLFRDILKRDPEIRQEYETLKQHNAKLFAGDRKGYTAAKAVFIRSVLANDESYDLSPLTQKTSKRTQ